MRARARAKAKASEARQGRGTVSPNQYCDDYYFLGKYPGKNVPSEISKVLRKYESTSEGNIQERSRTPCWYRTIFEKISSGDRIASANRLEIRKPLLFPKP